MKQPFKVALTWDYELYFGARTGTVAGCMLDPANSLLEIAETTGVRFTFFADAGFLWKATLENDSRVQQDLKNISTQIKQWDKAGHETGLHIHPHWEDCHYKGGSWQMNLQRYKLIDFSKKEAASIISKYTDVVKKQVQQPIKVFRAGGWCVQPFHHFSDALYDIGIRADSSVFRGGINMNNTYQYDFSKCPLNDHWTFNNDVCRQVDNGRFDELAIGSKKYSPFFFWKLFVLGRLYPHLHKPLGNGIPASGGGSKWKFLTRSNVLPVSVDGYFVTKLKSAIFHAQKNNQPFLVVIGHPKACTRFQIKYLEKLIREAADNVQWVTISQLMENKEQIINRQRVV